jgi:hypothetical protein
LAGSIGKKITTTLYVITQKSPVLSYFVAEACNQAKEFPVCGTKATDYVKERELMKALKN